MKKFFEFLAKYSPDANKLDGSVVYGYSAAQTMVKVSADVRRRSHSRERDEAGREPEELLAPIWLLPGITINTSATDFAPIKQLQMDAVQG